MKNENWKQLNPVDQLTAIRWSLEGNLENFAAGIIDKELLYKRVVAHIEEIEQLEPFLKGEEKW